MMLLLFLVVLLLLLLPPINLYSSNKLEPSIFHPAFVESDFLIKAFSLYNEKDIRLNNNPKKLFGSCDSLGQIEELILIIIALTQSNETKLAKRLIDVWVPRATARFIYPNLIDLATSLESVGLKINLPSGCLNTISYILNKHTVLFSNKYIVN